MKKTYFEPAVKIGHVELSNIIATSPTVNDVKADEGNAYLGRSSNPIWD